MIKRGLELNLLVNMQLQLFLVNDNFEQSNI